MSAKRSILSTSLFAVTLWSGGALAAGAQNLSETYDIAKINQALQTAISRVSLADTHISNINVQLDASRTDIDKDMMGFDASLELSRVSFQKGPVGIAAKADIKVMQPTKAMPKGGINLKLKADVAADPVAMMKFIAQKENHCEKAKGMYGVDRLVADSHCQFSKQIATATSLNEMKDAFVAMRSGLVSSLSGFVTTANNELMTVQNAVVREEMAGRVKHAEKLLKFSEEAKIEDTADGFMVEIGKLEMFKGLLTLERAQLVFSPESVHMEKDLTINAGSMLYNAAKPEIKKLLKGLEAQETCAIDAVTSHMNIRVNFLNAMLD